MAAVPTISNSDNYQFRRNLYHIALALKVRVRDLVEDF
jgi:hypothetical protein